MAEVNRKIWRDGEFVAWQEATVHVFAQSLQRGSLAFDYMSVHQNAKGPAVFKLEAHVRRLINTCRILGLPLSYTESDLVDACAETVRRNPGAVSLKICALIASVEVELVPHDRTPSVFIAAYDSKTDIVAQHGGGGSFSPLLSLKVEREVGNRRPDILPPQAKVSANYTAPMFAKWKARDEGFDDIILLNEGGEVAEAPTSNIFIVDREGAIVTPPEDKVLLGITRESVLELADALGVEARVEDMRVEDLYSAAEVFLTATSVGVWPVIRIDDRRIGNGETGVITARLKAKLDAIARGDDTDFEHWLYYV